MISDQMLNNKAGLYLRLSNEDERIGESGSITNQRNLLTKYANENSLKIIQEYIDDGYSGTNFNRPAFQQMLKDAKSNKINVIITKDMSRLGREHIDTCYYIEKYFPENNIRYISVLDGVDSAIDNGLNDITPFKAVLNDMYAKDISKKVRSIKKNRAEQGLFMGTYAPYGLKKDPQNKNHLIIDEEVAWVVRKIFQLASDGKSPLQISYILTNDNIKIPAERVGNNHVKLGKARKGWNANTVRRILENQLYIGNMVLGRTKKLNYKSKRIVQVDKSEWIITKGTHEAIIDKATFDKVQMHMNKRKFTRERIHNTLLKGIITCKECGRKFGVVNFKNKSGKEILYYRCNLYASSPRLKLCTPHTNNADKLNEVILEEIRKHCKEYLDESKLNKIASNSIKKIGKQNDKEAQIKVLEKELEIINNRIDKTYDDRLNSIICEEDFQRIYNSYTLKKKELVSKIRETKLSLNDNEPKVNLNKIVKKFIEMKEITPTMIEMLVSNIEVSQDRKIYIHYKFKELN